MKPAGAEQELRALLRLDTLPGVGPAAVRRLVDAFGSASAALAARAADFDRLTVPGAARWRGDSERGAAVARGLERARSLGMTTLTWHDDAYPSGLRHLADPPPVLFLRGRTELLESPGVTVVGARAATARGRDVARRLGAGLGRAGVPVLSGLALGVDAAAHRGALDAGGPTIAVLGCGADVAYPRAHRRLFGRIVRTGLVLSEFLPGTPPLPHHFPRRNRILAALARAVVVVEAARRSGALITVEHALDLGLDVYSVPGPIDSPSCEGSNALLGDGARPVLSIDSFLRAVAGDTGCTEGLAELESGTARLLLDELRDGAQHVDALSARLGLPLTRTLALLTELELRGRVVAAPGMRYRRAG